VERYGARCLSFVISFVYAFGIKVFGIIIIIIFHYAYGARGYEAATNIQSWYATRTWSLIPSPKC
jgi:hypothetical protein